MPVSVLFSLLLLLTPVQAPPIDSKPELPRVVLIGDSIRQAYAPLVQRKLQGRVEIVRTLASDSGHVLRDLDQWLVQVKPVLVHLNCGLHDLKLDRETKKHQVELEAYQVNLKRIVERIRKDTSATLVFASTTPILDERHAKRNQPFDRLEADVQRYNEAAAKVMRAVHLPIHDLHWVVEQGGAEKLLGGDGTPYTGERNERLAEAVADCILRQLIVRRGQTPGAAPAGPTAADYYKNEKERDAVVPKAYREMPVGKLLIPESLATWKEQRPELLKKVVQSLGDLPPRPSPQRVRRITRELRPGYVLEKVAIDNGVDGEISALLLLPEKFKRPAPAIL